MIDFNRLPVKFNFLSKWLCTKTSEFLIKCLWCWNISKIFKSNISVFNHFLVFPLIKTFNTNTNAHQLCDRKWTFFPAVSWNFITPTRKLNLIRFNRLVGVQTVNKIKSPSNEAISHHLTQFDVLKKTKIPSHFFRLLFSWCSIYFDIEDINQREVFRTNWKHN